MLTRHHSRTLKALAAQADILAAEELASWDRLADLDYCPNVRQTFTVRYVEKQDPDWTYRWQVTAASEDEALVTFYQQFDSVEVLEVIPEYDLRKRDHDELTNDF